jgi:hypothetical protein
MIEDRLSQEDARRAQRADPKTCTGGTERTSRATGERAFDMTTSTLQSVTEPEMIQRTAACMTPSSSKGEGETPVLDGDKIIEEIEILIREEIARQADNDEVLLFDAISGMVDGVLDVRRVATAIEGVVVSRCFADEVRDSEQY